MKYVCMILILALLLSGCGQTPLETIADEVVDSRPSCRQMIASIPDEASVFTIENGQNDKLYICDGYTISMCTFSSGDLNNTFSQSTGYGLNTLTVINTEIDALKRYDAVWASIGENGDQVGKIAVIDDGYYHYVLTVIGDATYMGENSDKIDALFSSFSLENAA